MIDMGVVGQLRPNNHAMSVFSAIRNAIRRDDRSVALDDKLATEFAPPDIDKLRLALSLDELGKERGQRNEPPSGAASLDEVELQIVAALSTLRDESYDILARQMSVYDGRLARADLRTLAPEIKNALSAAEADFSAEVQKDTNYVFAGQAELRKVQEAYNDFRGENHIRRLAVEPSSTVLSFGLLAILFIVESAANASFFSATHPGGLVGALFEAAAISVINIAAGFVMGNLCLRYMQLPNLLWKTGMLIVLIGLILGAVVFNFAAAHYREAFHLVPPDAEDFMARASGLAIELVKERRWNLAGFQSYLMVVVGLLVVMLATYKGYTWIDPYPGFGSIAGRLQSQTQSYLSLIDGLVDQLKGRNKAAVDDIRDSIVDIRRRDEEYETIAAQRARLTIRYNSHLDSLQRTGETLLKSYRASNRAARTTAPPANFNEPWQPSWVKEEVLRDTTVAERKAAVRELLDAISKAQERLLERFGAALAEYEKLRDLHRDRPSG